MSFHSVNEEIKHLLSNNKHDYEFSNDEHRKRNPNVDTYIFAAGDHCFKISRERRFWDERCANI
jgi:hypothetical protein